MANTPLSAAALADIPLFDSMSASARERIVGAARVRSYPRGQVIFSAGDASDTLIVVLDGRIKVLLRSADGAELILALVRRGGLIGELGVTDGGPRSADAEALDSVELLFVPRTVIIELQREDPTVTESLLTSLAGSFRRLTDAFGDLVFLDLPRRVAKALLDLPADAHRVVDLGLSQGELSQQVAGTRQSVNQALRGFERRGWIELRGRTIVLRDPGALATFAGEDLSGS
jgi:CRP-like cAMP-binding protein